ncbi:potassium channel family protein [Polaribacter uvawellassae]|uniref:potassium channel family protein n=1 Tax=Polaribacter uvawellassae TaxID=3133495 RepID=UPI00321AEC23
MIKKILLLILFYCFSINSFSQEIKYKEYSYAEFFQLIENEKDSVFELKDASIKFNLETDKEFLLYTNADTIIFPKINKEKRIINKEIRLKNVQFINYNGISDDQKYNVISGLNNTHFKKRVILQGVFDIYIYNCIFDTSFFYRVENKELTLLNYAQKSDIKRTSFVNNFFKARVWAQAFVDNPTYNYDIIFKDNTFQDKSDYLESGSLIYTTGVSSIVINNNKFLLSKNSFSIILEELYTINFYNNYIENIKTDITFYRLENTTFLNFNQNVFEQMIQLDVSEFQQKFKLDWNQFKKGFISKNSYNSYYLKKYISKEKEQINELWSNKILLEYNTKIRIEDENLFKEEIKLLSGFYDYYKTAFDTKSSNQVYTTIKDLETERMAFEYGQKPTFETYFKWKINQFLKVFSAYGTEPARAVVFSMYVILLFAFIYLLFPNSWDAHGRKRIMNRYAFFFKYMNKKSGIHEVYLDNQKEDLLEFDEFKTLVAQQGKTVPKFFTATALPLYKWAISGTKFSASVLKRVDIMKGTWNDLPLKKRWWKSFLLIGAFLIAICYDILIKMLNALMLSINTFTTLGFGEIPIKGLPRYLAIIQGFIGWFMLTIFSVSLISQLLN